VYTTEIFTDSAISFMERNKERSFLLTLSYNAVHDLVQQLPQKYLEKHNLPGIPSFDCKNEDYHEYYKRYRTLGTTPFNEMRRYYLANVQCLDDNLGRLLNALDKLKLRDNTLIVFIGDNGGSPQTASMNLPLAGYKYTLYEGGIRVPMIIHWPSKLPSGVVCDQITSALDILPTCLDASNLEIPKKLYGIRLLSHLQEGDRKWPEREMLFFEFDDQFAVIDSDYKLLKTKEIVLSYNNSKSIWPYEDDSPRLYNLKQDPGERVDLSENQPEIVKRLMCEYEKWYKKMHQNAERIGWDDKKLEN
jgi:arylsulfatase A-like enzyme